MRQLIKPISNCELSFSLSKVVQNISDLGSFHGSYISCRFSFARHTWMYPYGVFVFIDTRFRGFLRTASPSSEAGKFTNFFKIVKLILDCDPLTLLNRKFLVICYQTCYLNFP